MLHASLSIVIINIVNATKRLDAKVYSRLFLSLIKETKQTSQRRATQKQQYETFRTSTIN